MITMPVSNSILADSRSYFLASVGATKCQHLYIGFAELFSYSSLRKNSTGPKQLSEL